MNNNDPPTSLFKNCAEQETTNQVQLALGTALNIL